MERKNLILIEWPAYWCHAKGGDVAVKSNAAYAVGLREGDQVRVLVPVASGRERALELIATPGLLEAAMAKNCHASFVSNALKTDYQANGGPGQSNVPPSLVGEKVKPATRHPIVDRDPTAGVTLPKGANLGAQYTAAQKRVGNVTPAPAPRKPPVDQPPLF